MENPPAENRIRVSRTARYFTLGESGTGLTEAWFVLHGYRQAAARFLRRFAVLEGAGRRLVAPEGLSRFYIDRAPGRHGPEHRVGASWMTREDRRSEIRDYVAYLDALGELVAPSASSSPVRRIVLGFSQGAHTASRWVALGQIAPEELVLWGTGLAEDLDEEGVATGLKDVRVTFVRGSEDPYRNPEGEARQEKLLERAGVPYRMLSFAGGHEIADGPLLEIVRVMENRV